MSHSQTRRVIGNLIPPLLCLVVGITWAWSTKDLREENRELTRQTAKLAREHSQLTAELERLQNSHNVHVLFPPED